MLGQSQDAQRNESRCLRRVACKRPRAMQDCDDARARCTQGIRGLRQSLCGPLPVVPRTGGMVWRAHVACRICNAMFSEEVGDTTRSGVDGMDNLESQLVEHLMAATRLHGLSQAEADIEARRTSVAFEVNPCSGTASSVDKVKTRQPKTKGLQPQRQGCGKDLGHMQEFLKVVPSQFLYQELSRRMAVD